MLVKDIILKVCDFIENKELALVIKTNDGATEELAEELEVLIKCFNLVRNEIATEVLPNVKIATLKSNNKKIEFSSLNGKVIEILSVKDKNGYNIKFDAFADHILLDCDREVEIRYNASPEELDFEGEFTSNIPERVYAYGVVREYYYIQTLYEDASIWEERFKNSLQALERKKSEIFIPRRRWL